MSNFPTSVDDDTTLPPVNDNIVEVGETAINSLRDAVFNIEYEVGIGASGSTSSLANRIGISLNPDGTIKASALTGLGLVTLPIYNSHIAASAAIDESKLNLTYSTSTLNTSISTVDNKATTATNWISITGSKVSPHIAGTAFNHELSHVLVSSSPSNYLINRFGLARNNTNSYTVLDDLNDEMLAHQKADGYTGVLATLITGNSGATFPATHAHPASGIYVNTSQFSVFPQTFTDAQQLFEYIDDTSILLYGSRIQNFYSNGVSRTSRSNVLALDGYGPAVVPPTQATTYLRNTGFTFTPVDDINTGDDIIQFTPSASVASASVHTFDSQFASVKVGDIVRVNYGSVEAQFLVKEKRYQDAGGGSKTFLIRIEGKNLAYTANASVRIDRSLVNDNKYGVLAIRAVENDFSATPSLVVGNPRGAMVLGNGFDATLLDSSHYNLYLVLYPTGNPADGYNVLPAIDVTGDQGVSPGSYTLAGIVETINRNFKTYGYNYRFTAFEYEGQFGLALAESYGNAGFSIVSAITNSDGSYNESQTNIGFSNNVIDVFPELVSPYRQGNDPLGLGPANGNVSSPLYNSSYGGSGAATLPVKLYLPLKRNTFYVNGNELDSLASDVNQVFDQYGDGYWTGTLVNRTVYSGRVEMKYRIPLDLQHSGLKVGKTAVCQSLGQGGFIDFGRFIISNVEFYLCGTPDGYTFITFRDGLHGNANGSPPYLNLGNDGLSPDKKIAIYFNSDSVSFNDESATDYNTVTGFKRHFEVYVNGSGKTFTHERGRIANSDEPPTKMINSVALYSSNGGYLFDLVKISPKLRGYQFSSVVKINLYVDSYDSSTGVFTGYLSKYDGSSRTNRGPTVTGRRGEVVRFYDETNLDYVDVKVTKDGALSAFVNNATVDLQLFPTLSLDPEVMLLASCQFLDGSPDVISHIMDRREYGNVSEKELSSSALGLISAGEKYLHGNGVVRGFDLDGTFTPSNPNKEQIKLKGGIAVVDGKFVQKNAELVSIPILKELDGVTEYNIAWCLCVNSNGDYEAVPLLDHHDDVSNPNSSGRRFLAKNPISGGTYYLTGYSYSDLLGSRKDLLPMYLVLSTVTGSGSGTSISLKAQDLRTYSFSIDSNIDFKLISGSKQSNLQSAVSLFNNLRLNSKNKSHAYLRGLSETIYANISLDSLNGDIVVDGHDSTTLTIADGYIFKVGSNVTLKNLNLVFGNVDCFAVVSGASNIKFENCSFTFGSSFDASTVPLVFSSNESIRIKDCTFSITFNNSALSPYFMSFDSCSKVKITGSDFTVNNTTVYPGVVLSILSSSRVKVLDCTFSGNYACAIQHYLTSRLDIVENTFNVTYNPKRGVAADYSGYVEANFVNLSSATNNQEAVVYGYLDTNASASNININDNTFEYTAVADGYRMNRMTFVGFKFASEGAKLSNVNVSKNQFSHINASTNDDKRAVIAFINTVNSGTDQTVVSPILENVKIEDNNCNLNQMIVITSDNGGYVPGVQAINVNISKNSCGTIGALTSSGRVFQNVSFGASKEAFVIISDNNCKFICTPDGYGKNVNILGADDIRYATSHIIIKNNKTSSIHVSKSYEEWSTVKILENTLTAYNGGYVESLSNGMFTGDSVAIAVVSNNYTGSEVRGNSNNDQCIIANNTIGGSYYLNDLTAFPSTSPTYLYGKGIYVTCSANILNNEIRGLGGASSFPTAIWFFGPYINISGNSIYRDGRTLDSYIEYAVDIDYNPSPATAVRGFIVDNYLDDYTINGINESVFKYSTGGMPDGLIVERNINQTGYMAIPLTNGNWMFERRESGNTIGWGYVSSATSLTYATAAKDAYAIAATDHSINSNILRINDGYTAAVIERNWGVQEGINKFLPNQVKIINMKLYGKIFTSGSTLGNAAIAQLYLSKTRNNISTYADSMTMGSGGTIDNIGNGGLISEILQQSLALDLDVVGYGGVTMNIGDPSNYITHKDYVLTVGFNLNWTKMAAGTFEALFPPIVIKYRW